MLGRIERQGDDGRLRGGRPPVQIQADPSGADPVLAIVRWGMQIAEALRKEPDHGLRQLLARIDDKGWAREYALDVSPGARIGGIGLFDIPEECLAVLAGIGPEHDDIEAGLHGG